MSVPTRWPLSVVAVPRTTLGSTRTPPLATALMAAAICRALTEIDWPNATRSWVWEVHSDPDGTMPADSPRTPTSVASPSPKAVR